jgi:hypothetical protein
MIGLGIAGMTLAILGAAAPPPKISEANKFVLRDDTGHERAELSMDDDIPVLRMLNTNGTIAVEVASAQTGNGVWVRNPSGQMREAIVVDKSESNFAQMNAKNVSFHLSTTDDGTQLRLFDRAGQPRLALSYDEKLGSGLGIFDISGKLRTLIEEGWASTTDESGSNGWRTEPLPTKVVK